MPDDLLTKILEYVLKAIPGALLTGTGYQFFDGRWFGQAIFNSYLLQQSVSVLTPPATDDLYSALGSQSLTGSIGQVSAVGLLLSVILLLALVAHVLAKKSIAAANAAPAPGGSAMDRISRLYVTHYFFITLGIFGVLVSLFVLAQLRVALVVLLVLITVPAALYLVVYSKDAMNGMFVERFVWVSLLIVLLISLFGWPYLYGRRLYDPSFVLATTGTAAPDHCDGQQLSKGPIYVAADNGSKTLFFRMCFRPPDSRYIDFFSYDGPQTRIGTDRLSLVLTNFVPPPAVPGTLDALRDQLTR